MRDQDFVVESSSKKNVVMFLLAIALLVSTIPVMLRFSTGSWANDFDVENIEGAALFGDQYLDSEDLEGMSIDGDDFGKLLSSENLLGISNNLQGTEYWEDGEIIIGLANDYLGLVDDGNFEVQEIEEELYGGLDKLRDEAGALFNKGDEKSVALAEDIQDLVGAIEDLLEKNGDDVQTLGHGH